MKIYLVGNCSFHTAVSEVYSKETFLFLASQENITKTRSTYALILVMKATFMCTKWPTQLPKNYYQLGEISIWWVSIKKKWKQSDHHGKKAKLTLADGPVEAGTKSGGKATEYSKPEAASDRGSSSSGDPSLAWSISIRMRSPSSSGMNENKVVWTLDDFLLTT